MLKVTLKIDEKGFVSSESIIPEWEENSLVGLRFHYACNLLGLKGWRLVQGISYPSPEELVFEKKLAGGVTGYMKVSESE